MSVEILDKLFGAVDRKDLEGYLALFTEDAEYKAGNYAPVYGPQAIGEFGARVIPYFTKVEHIVKSSWQKGNTVVAEMELVYHRKDGKVVTVPCLDIIRLKNGKVQSLRAYLDATPAFA